MNVQRRLRLLTISNVLCLGMLLFFVTTAFISNRKEKFTEIDAERINIVTPDGKIVMAISNKRLIPGPSMNGKTYPKEISDGREHLSGIIFFNEQGDEAGGLVYNGIPRDSGYSSLMHMSFDQWKQNQVLALQYIDNGKTRRSGLRIWDRPTDISLDKNLDVLNALLKEKDTAIRNSLRKELRAQQQRGETGAERMFIGSQDQVAQIQLRDKKGLVKVKLYVDANGQPKLEFYNEKGEVTSSLPLPK